MEIQKEVDDVYQERQGLPWIDDKSPRTLLKLGERLNRFWGDRHSVEIMSCVGDSESFPRSGGRPKMGRSKGLYKRLE